jgi:hypothetical protein
LWTKRMSTYLVLSLSSDLVSWSLFVFTIEGADEYALFHVGLCVCLVVVRRILPNKIGQWYTPTKK